MNFSIRKAILLGVIISLSQVLNLVPAQAQGELRVVDSSVRVLFPYAISFILDAENDVDITDIRLHYKVLRHSFADVTGETCLEFEPSTTVGVIWNWDMTVSYTHLTLPTILLV